MKITKEQLKQIIKEELEAVHQEGMLPSLGDIKDMITKSPEERAASRKRKAEMDAIDHHRLIIMCHEQNACGKLFKEKGYDKEKVAEEYAELLKYDKHLYNAAKNADWAYPNPNLSEEKLEEQEGSFLQISVSDDGYDKDIEQISSPDEVDVDVSENPYVAYRAVVKVIKSSGEL